MVKDTTFKVAFRRRCEGKTNYVKRLKLIKGRQPRLVVRRSNRHILVQVIKFEKNGDKVIAQSNSKELEKFGWNCGKKSLPAAYLTGLLAGLRARKAKIENAVLDIGFHTPVHGAKWFSALKGALDSGLKVPFDKSALPSEERISGKHIEEYAKKLSDAELKARFAEGTAKNVDLKNLTALFESTKKNILQEVKP